MSEFRFNFVKYFPNTLSECALCSYDMLQDVHILPHVYYSVMCPT